MWEEYLPFEKVLIVVAIIAFTAAGVHLIS
jgi:hypothetical protein